MKIHGKNVDNEGRCVHYNKAEDVVAIKFKCCSVFYACYKCHNELNKHQTKLWEKEELKMKLILCGICKGLLSAEEYMKTKECIHCQHNFNPKCELHHHLYFTT